MTVPPGAVFVCPRCGQRHGPTFFVMTARPECNRGHDSRVMKPEGR